MLWLFACGCPVGLVLGSIVKGGLCPISKHMWVVRPSTSSDGSPADVALKSPTRTWAAFRSRSIDWKGASEAGGGGCRLNRFVWKCAKAGGAVVERVRLYDTHTRPPKKIRFSHGLGHFFASFSFVESHTLALSNHLGTHILLSTLLAAAASNFFRVWPETSGPPQHLDALCRRLVIRVILMSCRMDTIESPKRPPPEDEKTPFMYIQKTVYLYNHCLSIVSIDTGASFRLIIGRTMGSGVSPQPRCVCPYAMGRCL